MSTSTLNPDRVTIRKAIASGAHGAVYAARCAETGQKLAVKIIPKNSDTERGRRSLVRARQEAELLTHLDHKHVVKLLANYETDRHVYLVMPLAKGGDLLELLNERGGRPLAERDARRLFRQLVLTLVHLHNKRIVHRDIKPENILLDFSSLGSRRRRSSSSSSSSLGHANILLADFGFATRFTPGGEKLNEMIGTVPYCAPEIVTGRKYAGPEVDVWGCGAVLLTMLIGTIPFDSATADATVDRLVRAEWRSTVPADVVNGLSLNALDLIGRLLQPDPAKRATLAQVVAHPWLKLGFSLLTSRFKKSPKMNSAEPSQADDDDQVKEISIATAAATATPTKDSAPSNSTATAATTAAVVTLLPSPSPAVSTASSSSAPSSHQRPRSLMTGTLVPVC